MTPTWSWSTAAWWIAIRSEWTHRDVTLVVEIVSPGSRRTDRVMKPYEYAKAGIEHYWIVDLDADPDERFLAHLLREGTYQRVGALWSVTGYKSKNLWRWNSHLTS